MNKGRKRCCIFGDVTEDELEALTPDFIEFLSKMIIEENINEFWIGERSDLSYYLIDILNSYGWRSRIGWKKPQFIKYDYKIYIKAKDYLYFTRVQVAKGDFLNCIGRDTALINNCDQIIFCYREHEGFKNYYDRLYDYALNKNKNIKKIYREVEKSNFEEMIFGQKPKEFN